MCAGWFEAPNMVILVVSLNAIRCLFFRTNVNNHRVVVVVVAMVGLLPLSAHGAR